MLESERQAVFRERKEKEKEKCVCVYGWMDGWMDGRTDRWTDGRTHGFGCVIDVYLHIMKKVTIFGVKGKYIWVSS